MITRLQPSQLAVHGGRSRLPIDLTASLNPLGPSPAALEAARFAELGRYPEPDARSLLAAAATRHRIPSEAVIPVPGASWGLWFVMVAHARAGLRCLSLGPCFGEYRRVAEIAGCAYEETNCRLEEALASGPNILLVGNPANPAATVLTADQLAAACADHPDTLFVVDEAFAAFAPVGTSLIEGRVPPANTIVIRSLTKELGLPGLRMGYLVAREERAGALRAMLPAWPLSAPALAAGVAGCGDLDHIRVGAEVGRAHVRAMAEAFVRAGGEIYPSSANYLLGRQPGLLDRLAARGIAGRDCESFGLPDHVRLGAPSPSALPLVLEAIGGF